MVLEEQHEKTESAAQWEVKRTPLVSVLGSITLHWGQIQGMEAACVRRLQPKRNLRRQRQKDGSWGKGRGCSMLKSRDRVSAASVMYCDVPLSY